MTATDKQPMTKTGKMMLEQELKRLTSVERPDVIRAIEEARSNGDLSENADYDAAKERQGFIEARISEIQTKIANAEVVDPARIKADKIVFGATVRVLDCENDEEKEYRLVGEDEADAQVGMISIFSPLARVMIGKKVGDIIEFQTPKGDRELEVLSFEYK